MTISRNNSNNQNETNKKISLTHHEHEYKTYCSAFIASSVALILFTIGVMIVGLGVWLPLSINHTVNDCSITKCTQTPTNCTKTECDIACYQINYNCTNTCITYAPLGINNVSETICGTNETNIVCGVSKTITCYYQANDVVDTIATNDDYYQNETNNVLEPMMGVFCGIAIFFFITSCVLGCFIPCGTGYKYCDLVGREY